MVLEWFPPATSDGLPITNYRIYRGTTSGGETFLVEIGDVLTYTDTAVTGGVTYYYQVSAVNADGEGPLSDEASATPTSPPAPPVVSVSVSDTLITDADATATLTVTITYDEDMDTAIAPTITFDPDVVASGTLTFSTDSWDATNTIYTANYNIVDVDEDQPDVDITVTGAQDSLDGNTQVSYTEVDPFDADKLNPTVVSVGVSINPLITDANASSTFTVTITYSETMNSTVAPTITFSPDVVASGTLMFSTGSWDGTNTIYTASYTVADVNEDQPNIDITVSGAQDSPAGNTQVSYTEVDPFDVDTSNPTSSVDAITAYWQVTSPLTVTVTAADTASVELFYRYRASPTDTWGSWTSFATDTASPWSFSFTFPSSGGYYEFYSIATYNAGNLETAPPSADETCAYVPVDVATTNDVGLHTSITVDGSGNIHISYYDNTNGDLRYALWSASTETWSTEQVDGATENVGQYTSIEHDGTYVQISYYNVTDEDLKYARRSA